MSPKAASSITTQRVSKGTLLNLPAEMLGTIVANLDRPALWALLVTCRALKGHAERTLYEKFYLRRCIRSKTVVFRAVERIIDNPDLAVRVRRLDLRSTWSTINIMFMKLAPRLRAALQATKMLQTLALPYDFPSTCYMRTLPGVVLPRLQHLNMHHVCVVGYPLGLTEYAMLHDNVPWIRKHIGPLTHIELRCAGLDTRIRSFQEQANLILDTTESHLPVVPAQYFRSTASVLERLLAHTIADTPGRKKLAHGGTVHVRSVILLGDPAVTPRLLNALSISDHMIGMLVLDLDAAFQAVDHIFDRSDRTWEFKSLRHLRISSAEDDVMEYPYEHLTSMLRKLFERIAMPALETLEVATLCDGPPSGDVALFLCGILADDCPALVAVKVDDETLVRAAAAAPWAAGTSTPWPDPARQPQWPFSAPPGFEERPRPYDGRLHEERRCRKAVEDRWEFLYDADSDLAATDYNTYGEGDADFGFPDYPEYLYAATDPGDVEDEPQCAHDDDEGGSGEDERADEDENDDENEDEGDDDDDDDDDGWNDGWSGRDANTDDVEDNGYENAGEKNLGDALSEKPRATKSQGANA